MSRAGMCVKFPDGTIKWGIYNGTCNLLVPRLFDDSDTPWDAYYQRGGLKLDLSPEPEGPEEPVIIYSDYGGGFWWEGTATRNRVTSSTEPPDEAFDEDHEGVPDWVRWSVGGQLEEER